MRALEASAAQQPLMQRAGLAAAEAARELLAGGPPRVLVLAGPGNNGGDAFVVARWLKAWFFDVVVAFRGDAAKLASDARPSPVVGEAADGHRLERRCALRLIVDGLFGIGLTRRIKANTRAGSNAPARWRTHSCARRRAVSARMRASRTGTIWRAPPHSSRTNPPAHRRRADHWRNQRTQARPRRAVARARWVSGCNLRRALPAAVACAAKCTKAASHAGSRRWQ